MTRWNPKHWGLQQGMLGAQQQQTLNPSLTSIGFNRYLTREDFMKMLGYALLFHVVVLGVFSLFRGEQVKDIPVRALSFKIGDADGAQVAPPVRVAAPAPVAPPVMQANPATAVAPQPSVWQKNVAPPPRIMPPQPVRQVPPRTYPRQQPVENTTTLKPLPATPRLTPEPAPLVYTNAPYNALAPLPTPSAQPAVALNPQRFVRENTQPATPPAAATGTPIPGAMAAPVAAAPTPAPTMSQSETARARYTQQISGWIEQHKVIPITAQGLKGRTIVRVRIDRTGNVRYYAVEESSGYASLDGAAIDMVRRANPMPAAPPDYPEGNLIEFVIPINFAG